MLSLGPIEEWLPAANAALIVISGLFLGFGYVCIRRRRISWHRRSMITASVFAALFLVVYVGRYLWLGSKIYPGEGVSKIIYFGILIVVVVEIGLISPPVGMNLFVLNTLLPQVPTRVIFRGVLPFMAIDCVRLAILTAFPIISTYLPSLMK